MSVLKNNRNIAFTEFERKFFELYELSERRTMKIAKRRKKWIANPIDIIMNRTSMFVMGINTLYFEKNKRQEISALAHKAMTELSKLEKLLLVMWNIEKYDTRRMAAWVTLIREVYVGLNRRTIDKVSDDEIGKFMILDWEYIKRASFCQIMSNLHRYTHGKVTNANCGYDATHSSELIDLVDSAFYHVMKANSKIPQTKEEYEKRKQHISKAISALYAMNRPMLFYFNIMHYSERVMSEWSNLVNSEIKCLYKLQKSDESRFSKLE